MGCRICRYKQSFVRKRTNTIVSRSSNVIDWLFRFYCDPISDVFISLYLYRRVVILLIFTLVLNIWLSNNVLASIFLFSLTNKSVLELWKKQHISYFHRALNIYLFLKSNIRTVTHMTQHLVYCFYLLLFTKQFFAVCCK